MFPKCHGCNCQEAKGNHLTEGLLRAAALWDFSVSAASRVAPGTVVTRKSLLMPKMRKVPESRRPLKRQLQLTSGLNTVDLRAEGQG